MTRTAASVVDGALDSLSERGLSHVLRGLAATIDGHPREVFLRGDLVEILADLVLEAQVREQHQTRGGW